MRSIAYFLTAGAIGAVLAFSAAPSFAAPATVKTAAQCNAEWTANKAALQAAKQRKGAFVTACRAGTETIPSAPAAATTPAAAPGSAPPPASTPAAPVTPPKPTTPPKPAAATAPTSASEAAAQATCPTGLVVWVNRSSKVYHFKGNKSYGTTKAGTYMCEAAAMAAGDRAAKNEKHP